MPVVFSNPQFPLQVGPNGSQSFVQQLNFRQMIEQVIAWNPMMDPMWAGRFLNDAYREVLQRRRWYALKVRGSVNIANTISGGQAVVTQGSNLVQGIGTSWDTSLIGLQFRVGFTYPYQTIFDVDQANQVLTVDTPFGGQSTTGGYNIVEAYVSMGANFLQFNWAMNQQQGWPMEVQANVEMLNAWDVWRQSLGWSTVFAVRAPTPDGQFQIEIWPTPYQQQVFPFEGWVQPSDMEADQDSPASFIRADLLVKSAASMACLFGGRSGKYYNPEASMRLKQEYDRSLESMENADNQMDQMDVTWDYGHESGRVGFGPGSTFAQSHDM